MSFIALAVLALGFISGARQAEATPTGHGHFPPYHRPSHGDARSACPGINALANHGWLPHNGRNITLPVLTQALLDGFAVDAVPPAEGIPTLAEILFDLAIKDPANNSTHPDKMSFDLDKVNSHNFPIEFDGSLSRKDNFFGSDVKFDKQTWDVQWSLFEQEGFVNGTYISLSAAAAARTKHVLLKSQAGNPEFRFTPETFGKSAGTTAMYMLVLGGSTGFVNKEWVRALFYEERIPYEEGFTPRDDVGVNYLGDLVERVKREAPTNLLCSFEPDVACPGNTTSSAV